MKKYYLQIERIKELHKTFGFLDKYITPSGDEIHHIGPNIDIEDIEKTKLLRELGEINVRREQIINKLLKL